MKKKICIVGLISLFTWNVLLGAFGGLLLCIHQDLDIHVDDESACETACPDAHEEEAHETESCLSEDESCVDIELIAEQLPATRLNSGVAMTLPQATFTTLIECVPASQPSLTFIYKSAAPRAPPQARWLTDFYLQTTVLRV